MEEEDEKSSFFACAQLCVCVSICLCPQESNLPKYTRCFGAKSLLHNVVYEGMCHRLISVCHVQPVLPSTCITNLLYTTTAIILWKRRSSLIKYLSLHCSLASLKRYQISDLFSPSHCLYVHVVSSAQILPPFVKPLNNMRLTYLRSSNTDPSIWGLWVDLVSQRLSQHSWMKPKGQSVCMTPSAWPLSTLLLRGQHDGQHSS